MLTLNCDFCGHKHNHAERVMNTELSDRRVELFAGDEHGCVAYPALHLCRTCRENLATDLRKKKERGVA